MRWLLSLLTCFMAISCGHKGKKDPNCDETPIEPTSIEIEQDVHGFVETDKCDSLLFSAMIASVGFDVDILAAENSPGEWYRRPTSYPECWSVGQSRSTISRDMLLGLYWYAWSTKNVDILYRLWDYGVENNWVMGDGRLNGADTIMNTAMISTLAQMIYKLDGRDLQTNLFSNIVSRHLPVTWSVSDKPFVNRLSAMHILLRQELFGSVGFTAKATTRTLVEMYPDNPLFLLSNGNVCSAIHYANMDNFTASGVHGDGKEYVYERIFVLGRLLGR